MLSKFKINSLIHIHLSNNTGTAPFKYMTWFSTFFFFKQIKMWVVFVVVVNLVGHHLPYKDPFNVSPWMSRYEIQILLCTNRSVYKSTNVLVKTNEFFTRSFLVPHSKNGYLFEFVCIISVWSDHKKYFLNRIMYIENEEDSITVYSFWFVQECATHFYRATFLSIHSIHHVASAVMMSFDKSLLCLRAT